MDKISVLIADDHTLPIKAIHPVTTIDPAWFKEQESQDAHRA